MNSAKFEFKVMGGDDNQMSDLHKIITTDGDIDGIIALLHSQNWEYPKIELWQWMGNKITHALIFIRNSDGKYELADSLPIDFPNS